MNTLSKIVTAILISLTLVGCNYKFTKVDKPNNIYYMNDALNKWRDLKLRECQIQTEIVVLGAFESRIYSSSPMTEKEVNDMHNYLMDRCVLHNKLSI